jgi:plasmid stabilization system protein ParE
MVQCIRGEDKDQPLAGNKDATAAWDRSAAATVKVLGDVAESYRGGKPRLIGGHRAITGIYRSVSSLAQSEIHDPHPILVDGL